MDGTLIPKRFADVTKSDSTILAATNMLGLFVGTAGTVKAKGLDDVTATFKAVAGQIIPGQFRQVLSTGTDASDIVALYR